jgi:two-component system nitrogen regulation sensor histidine kinase GlnL
MARDLAQVLDALLDGVVVIDAAGRIDQVNAEACRILEAAPDALLGRSAERALGPRHPVVSTARDASRTGGSAGANSERFERRLGDALVVDVAAAPLFSAAGEPDGAVVVLRDRTLRDRLAHVVDERDRLAAFGRIAAGIAHELRNPLGGIRGAAEILGARATDPKTRDAAALVVREVDRINRLVDDLMVFGRGESLAFGPVNIHRVLDDVLDLLALDQLGAHARLERRYDPSLPEFLGDAERLTQVFLNLVRNALQALPGGEGAVAISTRLHLRERLGFEGVVWPALQVEIADTGVGIAPEHLDKIATPFFTTRSGGTGLGLAVSQHWIALHGGTLHVESPPGRGTRVRVLLPLRRAE